MKATGLFFVKNPHSTTPVIASIFSSISAGSTGDFHRQSRTMLPLSVITGPAFLTPSRTVHVAPSFSRALITGTRASAMISTGSGNFVPRVSTSFEPSATMARNPALYSTIFSRRCAAPPPLIRLFFWSISSAPSMARSR